MRSQAEKKNCIELTFTIFSLKLILILETGVTILIHGGELMLGIITGEKIGYKDQLISPHFSL